MKTEPHTISPRAATWQVSSCKNLRSNFKTPRLPHCHGNLNTTHGSLTPIVIQAPAFSDQKPKGATVGGPLQNSWPPSTRNSTRRSTLDIRVKTKGDQEIMIPLENFVDPLYVPPTYQSVSCSSKFNRLGSRSYSRPSLFL